jgi:hypothetical protein
MSANELLASTAFWTAAVRAAENDRPNALFRAPWAAALAGSQGQAWIGMQAKAGAPWIGTLDDPQGFLAARGWTVSMTQAGQPDAHFGRWALPVLPVKMPDMLHNWFVTAQKS